MPSRQLVGGSLRLTAAQAGAIYDVLVAECGGRDKPDARDSFVEAVADRECPEYRFGGALGMGGKFWNTNGGRLWVSCYTENETPRRLAMISLANQAIGRLLEAWGLAQGR